MNKIMKLISPEELELLLHCRAKLLALESGGVDNWCWYSESINNYLSDAGFSSIDNLVEKELQKYEDTEMLEEDE